MSAGHPYLTAFAPVHFSVTPSFCEFPEDPTQVLTAEQVQVHSDGSIDGLTPEAERLIWLLDLDGDDYRQWRLAWMRIIDLAAEYDRGLYRQLMGFPWDLPNLRRVRTLGGNSRPGVPE